MKIFKIAVFLLSFSLPLLSFSETLKLSLNGKNYSCVQDDNNHSSARCSCHLQDNKYVILSLNGAEITYWNGTGGDQMKACVEKAKSESVCEDSIKQIANCECKTQDSKYVVFHLNGAEITYWNGTGGDQMKACVQKLRESSFCR